MNRGCVSGASTKRLHTSLVSVKPVASELSADGPLLGKENGGYGSVTGDPHIRGHENDNSSNSYFVGNIKASTMNITENIVSQRDKALLTGDYNNYHAQNSRRIHTIRKRLGVSTPRGRKYTSKEAVTAENVAKNVE